MGRHRRTHLHRSQRSERDIQRHTYKHKCRPLFRTYQSCVNVLPQAANVPSQSHWWGTQFLRCVFSVFRHRICWYQNYGPLNFQHTNLVWRDHTFQFFLKKTFSWTLLLYIQRPCIFFAFHTWSWRYLENLLRCFCCGSLWEVQTLLSQHILEWTGRSHDMGMARFYEAASNVNSQPDSKKPGRCVDGIRGLFFVHEWLPFPSMAVFLMSQHELRNGLIFRSEGI